MYDHYSKKNKKYLHERLINDIIRKNILWLRRYIEPQYGGGGDRGREKARQ